MQFLAGKDVGFCAENMLGICKGLCFCSSSTGAISSGSHTSWRSREVRDKTESSGNDPPLSLGTLYKPCTSANMEWVRALSVMLLSDITTTSIKLMSELISIWSLICSILAIGGTVTSLSSQRILQGKRPRGTHQYQSQILISGWFLSWL